MKVAAIDTVIGAFAITEADELLKEYAARGINELIDRTLSIEERGYSSEFEKLIEALKDSYGSSIEVVVEDEDHARLVSSKGVNFTIAPGDDLVLKVREKLPELAVEAGYVSSPEEWRNFTHRLSTMVTRMKLRKVAQKRDLLAIQSIRAIDDIDKTINLFASRLREWYSVHFPELDDLVRDHLMYARIVSELGDRESITAKNLVKLGFSEGKAERIAGAAEESIGAELSDLDIRQVKTLANIMLELYKLRQSLTEYVSHVMREVAPNITELVGPLLGARLLSLAGSLEDLAKLPASTVQVLGAEKALFRALRTGGRPPKHGIIFQFPDIHRAPRWQRGKIARALATKLAIAAKADYFTGRFIADKLKKALMERIEEVKKLYPRPPPRAAPEKRPRRRPPRKGKGRKGR